MHEYYLNDRGNMEGHRVLCLDCYHALLQRNGIDPFAWEDADFDSLPTTSDFTNGNFDYKYHLEGTPISCDNCSKEIIAEYELDSEGYAI